MGSGRSKGYHMEREKQAEVAVSDLPDGLHCWACFCHPVFSHLVGLF